MSREFERLKARCKDLGFGFRRATEDERRRGWRYAVLNKGEPYAYAANYADVRFWLRGAPTILRGVHKA